MWSDAGIGPEKLQRLKGFQRMNHFPGMYALARKNNLAKHLSKFRKHYPSEYSFFPETWLLPSELNDTERPLQSPAASPSMSAPF